MQEEKNQNQETGRMNTANFSEFLERDKVRCEPATVSAFTNDPCGHRDLRGEAEALANKSQMTIVMFSSGSRVSRSQATCSFRSDRGGICELLARSEPRE